jgi:phosphatidylinositol glycan class B
MPDYGSGMRDPRAFLNQLLPDFASGRSGNDRTPAPTETPACPAAASARPAPGDRTTMTMMAVLLAAAFALRLGPALYYPGINHPDEIFQSLEQAHRAVFGYGVIPWEFEYGTRSWLLPGALAGLMWIGRLFGDSPDQYVGFIHVMLAALGATSVLCAFFWGERFGGRWGGLTAAALPAFWPDNLYFAGRPLGEAVAAPVLVIVLYLVETGRPPAARRRLLLAGFLLGVTLTLRLQLAPVAAVILLWCAVSVRQGRVLPLVVGLAAALALAGALDAATWGYPFQSMWLNFVYNTYYGVSSSFGAAPWTFYPQLLLDYWGGTPALLVLLVGIGAKRLPLPFLAAAVILLTHSLIPHKEYRFIYPAILLLLIVAGIGMAQVGAAIAERTLAGRRVGSIGLVAVSALLSLALALSPPYRELWQRGHDMVRAASYVSGLSSVCGIGAYGTYGGYVYFHQPVPFYWSYDRAEFERDLPAFNTMLTTEPATLAPGYALHQCFDSVCVAQRAGSCQELPMTRMPQPASLPGLAQPVTGGVR